jgi:hypothetical protein
LAEENNHYRMLHRKLLEVLSRLSLAEHKRLRMFLESPYFNHLRHPVELLRLYDYIMVYQADETHPALSKEATFRFFFPEKPYREKEKSPLDSLASDLFGLVKRFLAQQKWERTDASQEELFALLRFYREYGLEERFWQTIQALRKIQGSNNIRDSKYFYTQFSIEEEEFQFRSLFNTFEDDANLTNLHRNLDLYYGIVKLEYMCLLRYQNKLSQISFSPESLLMQAVLQLLKEDISSDVVLLKIYGLVFTLLQQPEDEEVFSMFEMLLEQSREEIPLDKYHDLQAFYRIFWSLRYNKSGDALPRHKMFEIYKKHFENGYFYVDGKISIAALRILNMFALKLGRFEWAKKVLDEHPPERICGTRYPAEAHSLNFGEYHFYKKEYEEAKERVTYRPFENPQLSILADVLLVKIYFETNDELLDYRMKALDQKVRRTKMAAFLKERYYNFLKKLDKVVKYGWLKNSAKRLKLIEEIKTVPEIIEREWLLEKLGEKG